MYALWNKSVLKLGKKSHYLNAIPFSYSFQLHLIFIWWDSFYPSLGIYDTVSCLNYLYNERETHFYIKHLSLDETNCIETPISVWWLRRESRWIHQVLPYLLYGYLKTGEMNPTTVLTCTLRMTPHCISVVMKLLLTLKSF